MIKKLTALIISAVLILPVLCAEAAEELSEAVAQADYSGEQELIHAVAPDYTLPEDAEHFTRLEFVRLLVDVMCPQGDGMCETGFSDVSSDDANAKSLGFAKDFGIVSPAEKFYPDEYVSYNQALKMAVTAAGYKPLADAQGAYPVGYVTLAQKLELTCDIEGSGEEKVSIKDGLKLICTLMDTAVFVQKSFGDEYVYSADDEITFISYYHRISTVYGVVYANEYSSLTNPDDAADEGRIKIGTSIFRTDGDFSELLGYNVKAYVKDDAVIYAAKHETDEVSLNPGNIDRVEDFSIITADSSREKKYTLDDSFSYILNGKAKALTNNDFEPWFMFDTGSVTLIDNNSDGKYDVVKALSFRYTFISRVSSYEEVVYDVNSLSNNISVADNGKYTIVSYENDEREEIPLGRLSGGMLVAWASSDDGMLMEITVCSNTVEGKITGYSPTNKTMFINGEEYEVSEYFEKYYSDAAVGTEASFMLGIDGKLVCVAQSGENHMKYGWIVGFSRDAGLSDTRLKIFSQNGQMEILTLTKPVWINGETKSPQTVVAFIGSLDDTSRLVRFSSNSAGELKRLDTFSEAAANELESGRKNPVDSLTLFASGTYTYKSATGLFVPKTANRFSFHIESRSFNFIIPPESDRTNDSQYGVVSTGYYGDDSSYSGMSVFDVDKTGCAGATLLFANRRVSRSLSEDEGSAVIEKITSGIGPDGENTLIVYAWKGNKYKIAYADPELTYDFINALNPGDIVRYITDENDIIISIARDFNIRTCEVASDKTAVGGISEYVVGMAYSASETYVNLLTNAKFESGVLKMPEAYTLDNIRNINISKAPLVYVDVVMSSKGDVVSALPRMSEPSDIRSWLDSGTGAGLVVSRQRYLSPSLTVVYNIEVK